MIHLQSLRKCYQILYFFSIETIFEYKSRIAWSVHYFTYNRKSSLKLLFCKFWPSCQKNICITVHFQYSCNLAFQHLQHTPSEDCLCTDWSRVFYIKTSSVQYLYEVGHTYTEQDIWSRTPCYIRSRIFGVGHSELDNWLYIQNIRIGGILMYLM